MINKELYLKVKEYLDQNYIPIDTNKVFSFIAPNFGAAKHSILEEDACYEVNDITDYIDDLDESFSDSLIRIIREKELDEVQVYKKANIDRRLFSKIASDSNYRPKKETVLAFIIALNLNLEESEALLNKAGFALSRSSKFDMIVKYFIENQIYDLQTIDEMLLEYDQKTISNY